MRSLLKASLGLAAGLASSLLNAAPLDLDLKVDRPLVRADAQETLVLRLGLKAPAPGRRRPALNLALVLDRSGSMSGGKIVRLREAALQALDRLRSDDILSIVAFDSSVQTLLPPGRLGDGRAARRAISGLEASGSTALYGGVSQGLRELREYLGGARVSRAILLSDGLANVGPSSPSDLAALGREAGGLGVPVTTFGLGLGYGEDLMAQLALASDGNHAFIPDEGGLARLFDRELGEALAIAARELVIEITLAPGVRYKRSLDREVEVEGQRLRWKLNQLPGGVEKRLLLEVEAPALREGQSNSLASAKLTWADGQGVSQPLQEAEVSVMGAPEAKAAKAELSAVVADAALARANLYRDEAIRLRDAGDAQAASDLLKRNAAELRSAQGRTGVGSLGAGAKAYEQEAAEVAAPAADWNATRKAMKAERHKEATQQSY